MRCSGAVTLVQAALRVVPHAGAAAVWASQPAGCPRHGAAAAGEAGRMLQRYLALTGAISAR